MTSMPFGGAASNMSLCKQFWENVEISFLCVVEQNCHTDLHNLRAPELVVIYF